jgi:deoxyribodipyrimidine photo-lyase
MKIFQLQNDQSIIKIYTKKYAGGVGADPRTDRYFNVIKQAYDYDEEGAYARMWIPQLANVQTKFVYCPYLMSLNDQKRVNCLIGSFVLFLI